MKAIKKEHFTVSKKGNYISFADRFEQAHILRVDSISLHTEIAVKANTPDEENEYHYLIEYNEGNQIQVGAALWYDLESWIMED